MVKIIWAGNEYLRFPIKASGFAFQRGQLPRPKIAISNGTGFNLCNIVKCEWDYNW